MNLLVVRDEDTADLQSAWRDLTARQWESGNVHQYVFDSHRGMEGLAFLLKDPPPCDGIFCWFTQSIPGRLDMVLKCSRQNSIPVYYVVTSRNEEVLSDLRRIEEYQPTHYFLCSSQAVGVDALVQACWSLHQAGFSGSYLVHPDGSSRLLKNYELEHPLRT